MSDTTLPKNYFVLSLLLGFLLCQGFAGCSRHSNVNASKDLEDSFQTASPEIKQKIEIVRSDLKAKDFLQACTTLNSIVGKADLDLAQKQAVGKMLSQINDAIAADPKLDSPEMYRLRQKLFRAIYDTHKP